MSRRVISLLSLALAVLAVAGCGGALSGGGSDGGGKGRQIVIGWIPPDVTGVFKTATDYFEKSAAEANKAGMNVKILTRSPQAHTQFAEQQSIIEDFIARHVDALVISPIDTEAIKPQVKQANQAGIPVIYVNLLEDQPGIDLTSKIGFDNATGSAVVAYSILNYFGGPGPLGSHPTVKPSPSTRLDLKWWQDLYRKSGVDPSRIQASGAVINGIAGDLFSTQRAKGFESVLDRYPGVKLLGKPLYANWNRADGTKAAEDLLSRFGAAKLNFMWAASNEMGIGAMNTLQRHGVLDDSGGDSGPQKGKVAVFTEDNTPESTQYIRQGKIIGEVSHEFPLWGWIGTEYAVKAACGEHVPPKYDVDPPLVWKGNADRFYPHPVLPSIDWKQIKADCKS